MATASLPCRHDQRSQCVPFAGTSAGMFTGRALRDTLRCAPALTCGVPGRRFLLRDAHNGASVRVTLFGRRTHRPHEGGKGSPLRSQDGEVHDPSEPCSKNPQHEDEHHRASSIAPTDHRLFSTVRAALMSGNLVSDCSGVMSIPTNAATKPKVKSMSRLPRMPARPPHHKVASACSLVRRAVWRSFTFGLLRSLMVAARHGYRARR